MTTFLFIGPSLEPGQVRSLVDTDVRICPPVRRGDVCRAIRDGASAIAIVDGVFGTEPSVAHKEILWALQHKIPVLGAASMGALRAAELAEFGMIGMGFIYEAYASGAIWRDDEVALAYGPEELNFLPISEPLVNIRATLRKGLVEGALAPEFAARVLEVAAKMFFAERTWQGVLQQVRSLYGDSSYDTDTAVWLERSKVDQKCLDAAELCRRLQATDLFATEPRFQFIDTDAFSTLRVAATNPFLHALS